MVGLMEMIHQPSKFWALCDRSSIFHEFDKHRLIKCTTAYKAAFPGPGLMVSFDIFLSAVSCVGSTTMRYQVWEEQWDSKLEAPWNFSIFWQVSIFMVWLRSEKPSLRITRSRYRQTETRFGKKIWNPTIWDKIHCSNAIMVRLGAVLVRVLEIRLIYLIRKGHFGTYFQLILGNLFH